MLSRDTNVINHTIVSDIIQSDAPVDRTRWRHASDVEEATTYSNNQIEELDVRTNQTEALGVRTNQIDVLNMRNNQIETLNMRTNHRSGFLFLSHRPLMQLEITFSCE